LDEWVSNREHFSDDEWIDLMVSSIGFNPDKLDEEEKMLYFTRLLPFVESNVNLVELGPPETGKTFNYRSLSSYGFVVSGSKTTIASLFYNKLRRKLGVVGYKDCVMFDEISHANWNGDDELVSMLKDFMNTGRFGRDTAEFASDCSIVFAGNIDCDRAEKEVKGWHKHLFDTLPQLVRNDRAFLDRIHGYIPGWKAPQIAESKFAIGFGFMADYLSEIMHRLRDRNYVHIINHNVDFGEMTQRNAIAVARMASGFMKIIYPHRTLETVEQNELRKVLDLSVSLRQRVVDQLAVIAPAEFGGVKLRYKLK
jgi:ATP-dependent Lon protease